MWVKLEKDLLDLPILKITDERKRVENINAFIEHIVDENVNHESVVSFNADMANMKKG